MTNEARGVLTNYPLIRVCGGPHERGLQYGRLARDRVHGSLRFYESIFKEVLNVEWGVVRSQTEPLSDVIEAFSDDIASEMRGLAEGAGIEYEDVVCLNCRTEILHAATVRKATGRQGRVACECSAFAAEASVTANGSVIVGQNWDYIAGCEKNAVLLSVERDDGPNYLTLVEAGLMGKMGMNEAGVTLTTNALITERDCGGEDGLPFHIILRALIDSHTVADGVAMVEGIARAGSGNYTIASDAGLALNIETAPGGRQDMAVESSESGVLAHTNHFVSHELLSRSPGELGIATDQTPSSVPRLTRLRELMYEHRGQIDRERMQSMLADHLHRPLCVCTHEDLDRLPHERIGTRAAIVMEPATREMWIAAGNPCVAPFRKLDTAVLGARRHDIPPRSSVGPDE